MKIILTGATGFAGGAVLEELIADAGVDEVLVLTRRPIAGIRGKVRSIVVHDFLEYGAIAGELKADACIWCLGISQTGMRRAEYVKFTYDYAIAGLSAMRTQNADVRFCFLSGQGADQTEKARTLFGKIKGRTERVLAEMSPHVYSFRPGFIKPTPSYPSPRRMDKILSPVVSVLERFTNGLSVDVDVLARCMIAKARQGGDQHQLENGDIRRWSVP